MKTTMRAKMRVTTVTKHNQPAAEGETPVVSQIDVQFTAVVPSGFDQDGKPKDDSNDFAKWTPTADAKFTITNPALFDTFTEGEEYYVDFSKA